MFHAAHAMALKSRGVGGHKNSSFRLGAVLCDKNRIVAVGNNSYKTHPVLRHLTKWPCIHAEQDAIFSRGLDNCQGLDLYVCRVKRDGSIGMSKPCAVCSKLIEAVGIRKVKWTE